MLKVWIELLPDFYKKICQVDKWCAIKFTSPKKIHARTNNQSNKTLAIEIMRKKKSQQKKDTWRFYHPKRLHFYQKATVCGKKPKK